MLIFTILAGILTVICLLILAPALLNKRKLEATDLQEQNIVIARQRLAEIREGDTEADEAQLELEAALIDDLKGPDYNLQGNNQANPIASLTIFLLIPIAAGLIYFQLGNHRWNSQHAVPTAEEIEANPAKGIELLLARLEQVLVEQPEDAAGWELAARTYMGTQQYTKAEAAYARLNTLSGEHPDTLAAWADASLMVNNNVFSDEIAARVNRALELDPENISALWLSAMGARSLGNREKALEYLARLLPLVEGNEEAKNETLAAIVSVGGEIPANAVSESQIGQDNNTAVTDVRQVSVNLSLSPELSSRVKAEDIVFLFATEKNGPPAPLAAVRLQVKDLPATILLDQSQAMIPGRTIDGPDTIEVMARVALSGKPSRTTGDLESSLSEVSQKGRSELSVSIDTIVN